MAFTAQEEITVLSPDSLASDSLASDSVSSSGMFLTYGLAFDPPADHQQPVGESSNGMSWILTVLFLVFMVVSLRYRINSRYFSALIAEITEVRERHNAFNDTLRETSFVWLLNLLWCGSAGFLLYGMLFSPESSVTTEGYDVKRIWICIGMAAAYTVFLTVAYTVVGALFSDGSKAEVWVKGYLSSQGLEAVALFPVALLGLCVPGMLGAMVIIGIIIFCIAKILFIYKGFCIFFTEIATWVLFLYYLCSLEIVPVVLTYAGARYFCE